MKKFFTTINVVDFEYEIDDGDLPRVLCMVVYVLDAFLRHIRTIRIWRGQFNKTPPFDIGPDALFVAYSAWAELICFIVLGWKFPVHVFDLHTAYLAASAISYSHMSRMKRVSDHANVCLMLVEHTRLKVGRALRRRQWLKTSRKAGGANMVASVSWNIAKKT